MIIFLSKFLPLFVYPVGLIGILLVAALIFRRMPRLRNGLIIAALAVLFLCGNRWTAVALTRSLEWRYFPPAQIPTVQAIVVLGGGTESAIYPRSTVELNGAGDRVLYAARLYKEGKAPYLLLSGGNITWLETRSSTPAQEMAEILGMLGVPQSALLLEDQSQNTYENALYSSRMLKAKGITRVLLVTSAMHMPRSVALFHQQGIDVIPAPTDYSVTQADWTDLTRLNLGEQLINLVPTASNLSSTSGVMKEYIGMLVYGLGG
jgi:uncharacterized SAM-binding protein YcdF (DUF218 family)